MEIADGVLRIAQWVTVDNVGDFDNLAVFRIVKNVALHLFLHALLTARFRICQTQGPIGCQSIATYHFSRLSEK